MPNESMNSIFISSPIMSIFLTTTVVNGEGESYLRHTPVFIGR